MTTVTVSSKFQIIIPKAIREEMEIKAGQKLQLIHYNDRIEIIPLGSAKEMRGFLEGIDTTILR